MAKTLIKSEKFNLWYGDFQALIDIDLDIPENQVTAVVGPSGCGKSTFVRCINRLNDQINTVSTKGSIFIDGTDIYQYTADEVVGLRRSVGMVFQRPNPFPLSVFENVAFGLKTNPMVPDEYTNVSAGEVIIGKHVIIGCGSVLLPNISIGEGVSVGALSLVKSNCDPFFVYAGNPLKKIKQIFCYS